MSKRNLDDTEAEILYENEQPENREVHRVILKDNPDVKIGQDSVRKGRISRRLKPVIDQRFDGVSEEAIEQDQDRQAFVSMLVKRSVEADNENELMEELFPKEGATFTPISEPSKQQGNVEMFEICELLNEVQCEHCRKNVPSGHENCGCGRAVGCTNPNPVIVEQLLNVKSDRSLGLDDARIYNT